MAGFEECQPGSSCGTRIAAGVLAAVLLVVGSQACKRSPPKATKSEQQAEDLKAVKLPGYNLHDNLSLSGALVHMMRDGLVAGAGVLVADDTVLAPGLTCDGGQLSVIFQSQGNEAATGSDVIKRQSRSIKSCAAVRSLVTEKLKASESNPPRLVTSLAATFDRLKAFELAIVKFEGGLPTGDRVKWKPVASHDPAITLASTTSEWRSWEALTGKFIGLAGFSRAEETKKGSFVRRIWLPVRIPSGARSDDPFDFSAETWIVDSDRSPIRYPEEWLKGPQQVMFPPMIFSGVARFPNVTADAEIQSPQPNLLAFVHGWDEIKEAPVATRFAPRCLDAAPILALLK